MPGSKTLRGALAAMIAALALPALAWAPEGHTVIARVATGALSPQASADLTWIVSQGVPALNARMTGGKCQIDPANPWGPVPNFQTDHDVHTNLANWPDCWRVLTPSTAPWHFDDIPLGDSPAIPLNAAAQAWCATGCVSKALADTLRALASGTLAPADAAMALAFVVHFVGDLHQPLHAEDNNKDLGGNQVLIKTTGAGVEAANLHALWDDPLVAVALGADLDRATAKVTQDDAAPPADWTAGAGTVDGVIAASDSWVADAHALARPAYSLLGLAVGAGPTKTVPVTAAYVQQEAPVVEGQIDRAAVRLAAALNAALTWPAPTAVATTPTGGYLNLAPLNYTPPPPPSDPLALELDLVQVRSARPAPTAIQWQEAASDADAYNAEAIVRRFDDSTGALLDEADRPLLVAMLRKVIADTGAYVDQAKAMHPRPRPYVEDPSITPCNTGFLTGKGQQSYPSGHAMNGYVVALAMAQVFPDRREAVLARGVRYGDNRVACGVHHPTDVEAGRLLGIAYFNALQANPAFRADLTCAQAEQAFVVSKTPLPAACAATAKAALKALRTPMSPSPNAANLF